MNTLTTCGKWVAYQFLSVAILLVGVIDSFHKASKAFLSVFLMGMDPRRRERECRVIAIGPKWFMTGVQIRVNQLVRDHREEMELEMREAELKYERIIMDSQRGKKESLSPVTGHLGLTDKQFTQLMKEIDETVDEGNRGIGKSL